MNGYITVQEAAEKWNITPRQVQILCKEGRIEGAEMMSDHSGGCGQTDQETEG